MLYSVQTCPIYQAFLSLKHGVRNSDIPIIVMEQE